MSIPVFVFLLSSGKMAIAEEVLPDASASAETNAEHQRKKITKDAIERRFKQGADTLPTIGLIGALDFTTLGMQEIIDTKTKAFFDQFLDPSASRIVEDRPVSLTMEEFRRILIKHNLTIAVIVIVKPTNVDVFLFDKRNPQNIFLNSEIFPEDIQYKITANEIQVYLDRSLRRLFISYHDNQYYELPRSDGEAFMSVEIPRWIASPQTFKLANRDFISNFYSSFGVGTALSFGNSRVWNSNCIGAEIGFRVIDNLFLEGAFDAFAYNVFSASAKYFLLSRSTALAAFLGLGVGMGSNQHTLNWDQNYTQGLAGMYAIPSVTLLIPIGSIHLKIESKMYYNISSSSMIIAVTPGFLMLF